MIRLKIADSAAEMATYAPMIQRSAEWEALIDLTRTISSDKVVIKQSITRNVPRIFIRESTSLCGYLLLRVSRLKTL